MRTINTTCVAALLLAFASGAYASIDAGQVQFVHGDSRALGSNGVERALKKGDPVYEGETVITGPSASLQLRMVDDAMVAVRPNSRLQIEVYRLDGKAEGYMWDGKSIEHQFGKISYPAPGHSPVRMLYKYGGSILATMNNTKRWVKM